jgi:hypothetical protein
MVLITSLLSLLYLGWLYLRVAMETAAAITKV